MSKEKAVLILVVVDNGLVLDLNKSESVIMGVLILVVVDNGLVHTKVFEVKVYRVS